jgi:hypothetical protein
MKIAQGYRLGANQFADLTEEEFRAKYLNQQLVHDHTIASEMFKPNLVGAP